MNRNKTISLKMDSDTFHSAEVNQNKRKHEVEDPVEPQPIPEFRRVRRRIDDNVAFVITVAAPSTIKKMIHILRTIVSRADFDVVDSPEFTGITVKSMDSSQSAMIDIRLAADVQFGSHSQNRFSIPLNQAHKLIEGFVDTAPLLISQKKLDSQLRIESAGAGVQMYSRVVNMNTLEPVDVDGIPSMNSIPFDYVVDFQSVPRLANFIKDAKGLDAQDITLRMFEMNNGSIAFHILFTASDASMEDCFISNTATEMNGRQQCVISRSAEFSTMDSQLENAVRNPNPIYNEVFNLNHLNSFISNIKANTITMRLGPKKPLLLENHLTEQSIIRFMIAPNVSND